jgi:hypothetical protein
LGLQPHVLEGIGPDAFDFYKAQGFQQMHVLFPGALDTALGAVSCGIRMLSLILDLDYSIAKLP